MWQTLCGDNLEIMRGMSDDSVDLTFTSPPYEDARTYGIDFAIKGQDWVDWAVARFIECLRVTKGLVAWVVAGKTRNYQWSATPALFMADLHRRGVKLRTPPIYHRVGIPGSGGPDWLRNDYEFIVCASHGKLPWSDNTACGHPPIYGVGGKLSNRTKSGERVGGSHGRAGERHSKSITRIGGKEYTQSSVNPGNNIQHAYCASEVANMLPDSCDMIHCIAGGGNMGSRVCHENEAPFPELLAEFFIKSFCPVGGTVLDPHCGSATTLAVAERIGRNSIGIDIRENQLEISGLRMAEVTK